MLRTKETVAHLIETFVAKAAAPFKNNRIYVLAGAAGFYRTPVKDGDAYPADSIQAYYNGRLARFQLDAALAEEMKEAFFVQGGGANGVYAKELVSANGVDDKDVTVAAQQEGESGDGLL